jgi:thioredoxin reductase (NADPH)
MVLAEGQCKGLLRTLSSGFLGSCACFKLRGSGVRVKRSRVNSGLTCCLRGDETLRAVHISGAEGDAALPCAGLFSFIGADPSSAWLNGCADLDDRGFVLTDLSLVPDQLGLAQRVSARPALPFETSRPGLFAVGDLRSGSTKRVAAAVGEGSAAVRSVHEYLAF